MSQTPSPPQLANQPSSYLDEKDDDKKESSTNFQTTDAPVDIADVTPTTPYDAHAEEVREEAAIEAAGQEAGTSAYVWMLTAISGVSGMLFGYDTGAINAVLVQVGTDINNRELSSGEKELITSALSVGAIGGAVIAGYLADTLGRKRTLVFCDFLFVIGAIVQATIHTKWPFAIGRLIMGIGVGSASMIAPVFISEISPVAVRGRLVCLNVVSITGGQVIATAIGAAFENVSSGWRWIVALGAVPPILQAIFIEIFFPESPRHLQKRGHTDKAAQVLSKMYPRATTEQIEAKSRVLQRHIAADTKTMYQKYKDLIRVPQLRRAAFLAALIQCAQQLSGFNALNYYSATIFSLSGLKNSTATSLVVTGVNFLLTVVALPLLDPFGRRNFLKVTIPIMIFGLLFSTVVFHYMTAPTDHYLVEGHTYDKTLASVLIVGFVVFVAGYAAGLGHIPWAAGDFFGQQHRGVGASVGAFANWSFNLVVASTFLRLMDAIRPAPTFGLYAALSAFLGGVLWFTYPESLSLSLEQAQSTLEGGFKVKESERLRKQNVKMLREQRKQDKAKIAAEKRQESGEAA